jgi:AAA domain/PLD-like domain
MLDVPRPAWLTELIEAARWMPGVSGADEGLADHGGLARIRRSGLVDRFGEGRGDPAPAVVPPSGGLNAEQARGREACLAPGLQLIWCPPGTGKTTVIASALRDLISHGKSVLLVSGLGTAVDSALRRAVGEIGPVPGAMVRAGTPSLAEVAGDPRICLERLVSDRLGRLDAEHAEVTKQIATLRGHPGIAALKDARAELAGFDAAGYREARQRIENENRLGALRARMRQIREEAAESLAALAAAQAEYGQARRSWEESALARQHLKAATDLEIVLGQVARDHDQAVAEMTRLEAERERVEGELRYRPGGIAGLGRRRDLRRLAGHAAELGRRLDAARARRREAERTLALSSQQVNAQVEAHLRAAEPLTHDAAARLRIAFSAAESRFRQAWQAQQECIQQARAVDGLTARAESQAPPTPADFDMVAWADEREFGRKLAGLPELERQAADVRAEIDRLEERAGEIVSQLAPDGRIIRSEIIGRAEVVATTLATLRATPELSERDYDHVLVDEAAAAHLPEIVYAVSLATEGATLLGDFRQNGPALSPGVAQSGDPAIRRWLHQDCFALFGIHDPESAQASPWCVTLTRQYRFGPALNDLVNAVAYGGLLRPAGPDTGGPAGPDTAGPADQEIVLVDADGLGEGLAGIRPDPGGTGQWWPIGAVISAALAARHHESSGIPVGILTPYECQRELIRSQLSDSRAPPEIEVGTSCQFQGREFDTVIFDLVENGDGWVAQGRQSTERALLDGLRTFTVGVTRAQRRLYLLGNEALLRKSEAGPLHALRLLVEQGRMRVLRAAEIIDRADGPADDPVASDIWNALRGQARLISLPDEHDQPDELCQRIDQAQERIWLWSPWVGPRPGRCIPHLVAAADRGVRVHAIVVCPRDASQELRARQDELSRQLPNVVFLHQEHQQMIVVDRKLVFIGCVHEPARSPGVSHEVMALLDGADMAQRLLRVGHADVLADPPVCPQCGARVREAADRSGNGRPRLHWVCRGKRGDLDCGWISPFPGSDSGR